MTTCRPRRKTRIRSKNRMFPLSERSLDMKRLSVLLAAALILVFAAGCTSNSTPPAKVDSAPAAAAPSPVKDEDKQWGMPNHEDRKSTRLNSSHRCISYAVFCLKKKKYI